MLDDGALLREYADEQSETAFAELVRRHLDLVYSTALRRVAGDEHLAKDVGQNVFIDLARKARGLSQRTGITGWLYTSACFAAAKAVLAERRRQAREHKANSMHEHSSPGQSEPNWDSIQPLLDSAMLELKPADREALLLRYLERCPLAEVGRKLGLTENAARMRVDRALEKLRNRLARQGVRSTAAALAVVLANQTLVAAPATLASAISSMSVATAAAASGSTFLTFIAMTKSNAIVLGLVLAAGAATPISSSIKPRCG